MRRNGLTSFVCTVLLFLGSGIRAQSAGDSVSFDMLELEGKLLLFVDKINAIAADVPYANLKQLGKADKEMAAIDPAQVRRGQEPVWAKSALGHNCGNAPPYRRVPSTPCRPDRPLSVPRTTHWCPEALPAVQAGC